tara:strand:+ start:670 stop:1902 length:1233 start_codon:yes stop_codon:yes gene_type:complete
MTKNNNNASKFYPIDDDWRSLNAKTRYKLSAGIKICGEPVVKFYNAEQTILYFFEKYKTVENALKDLEEKGYWFIPVYETKNFMQGLIYRPAKGSQIDKVYNREFYINHFEKLFKDGFDPVLAGVGDLLIDLRKDLIVNWDSRHRTVGLICASENGDVPPQQWNQGIVIKETAPISIRPEKVACDYFKTKNQSPKKLSGEESFVADVRAEDYAAGVCLTYMRMAGIRLDIHKDKLPELEEDAKITMKSVAQFVSEYNKSYLGSGNHLPKAVDSLKEVWPSVSEKFSVYSILGYTYMLEIHKKHRPDFGYDNDVMIKALKWKQDKFEAGHAFYTTPRENNNTYKSVAFRMGLIYNEYVESLPLSKRPDTLDLDKYIPMGDLYLMQIGQVKKKEKEDKEKTDKLNETFNTNP